MDSSSDAQFNCVEQPDQLLAAHATTASVAHHPRVGLMAATGVVFDGDRYRFAEGLSHMVLGVPFRPLARDADCRLHSAPRIKRSMRARAHATTGSRHRSEMILIGERQPYSIAYPPERRAAIDFLYVDPEWLRAIATEISGTPAADVQLGSDLKLEDGVVEHIARRYLHHVSGAEPAATLERDCTAHLLAVSLLQRHALAFPKRRLRVRPLDQLSLERVMAYVEGNLASGSGLGQLAAVAGLSPHHFLRSFRLATGLTPHQYLVASRIRRASVLLRETRASITDIAAETGFSSQAHMTRAFREFLSTTPAAWRGKR